MIDIIGRWATMGHVWYMWSCYERDFKIASTTIHTHVHVVLYYIVYIRWYTMLLQYVCTLYTYLMMYCMYMLGGTFLIANNF